MLADRHRRVAVSTDQSRSPVWLNARHAFLRECARSLRAQTHPLECSALSLLSCLFALVRLSLSPALPSSPLLHEIKTRLGKRVRVAHSHKFHDSLQEVIGKAYTDHNSG